MTAQHGQAVLQIKPLDESAPKGARYVVIRPQMIHELVGNQWREEVRMLTSVVKYMQK